MSFIICICFAIWDLADPGETVSLSACQYLKIVTPRVHFSNAKQPIRSPHSQLPALSGSSTLGHSVHLLYQFQDQVPNNQGYLSVRTCLNVSNQLIINLLTLPHLFLPSEATITCFPFVSCNCDASPCDPAWHGMPLLLRSLNNKLSFQGQ